MLRPTLEALYVLDAIDRKGNFAAAAEELHQVPSAINYTTHKLEEDLGVSLFEHRGRRALLTAAGKDSSNKAGVFCTRPANSKTA